MPARAQEIAAPFPATAPAGVPATAPPGALPGVKRTLDVALAGVLLLALLPLMALIAVAVRLESPGPALFRQRRLGRHMKPFTVNKFRTMRSGADPTIHREYVRCLIVNGRGTERHGRGGLFKLAFDDRITRVGRLLRRTSLDELPQLWNVLRGEMSLVGPRPALSYEAQLYPDWYLRRFAVKPGITGLWQVSGRNERTYEEAVRLDVEYVERGSVRLDLLILLKTIVVLLRPRGAA